MNGAEDNGEKPMIRENPAAPPSIVGTWRLLSYVLRDAGGGITRPMGEGAIGQIIYDEAGNMSCHLANPDLTAPSAYDSYSSYFGSYVVDAGAGVVRHDVLGATMPGWAGTMVVRTYAFPADDMLTLSAGIGDGRSAVLQWRRA